MDYVIPSDSQRRDNPKVFDIPDVDDFDLNDTEVDVWSMLHTIRDPEFPYTIGQLRVIEPSGVHFEEDTLKISISFKPTIEHCSMATLIGLAIRVKLLRHFPTNYRLDVHLSSNSHLEEADINKQLADKERVAAATENHDLMAIINSMIADPI